MAGVTATAVAGALATDPDGQYYRTLDKPSWQPPPPSTASSGRPLYADIALSAGHAISRLGDEHRVREQRSLIGALGVNLALEYRVVVAVLPLPPTMAGGRRVRGADREFGRSGPPGGRR